MIKRLAAALAAGREAAARQAPAPPAPTASGRPVAWALIHFGDSRLIAPRLAAHRAFCLRRGLQCLLVSNDIPQLCVTSREVRFEFCPWPADTAPTVPGGHAAAVDHCFLRLGLILDFWQVVGCDWDGAQAEWLRDLSPDWAHPVIRAARSGRGGASQPARSVIPLTQG
jgi:hypothetical protein